MLNDFSREVVLTFSTCFKVEQSLLVTGFGYEHDDPWTTNMDLFKEFTDVSRVFVF